MTKLEVALSEVQNVHAEEEVRARCSARRHVHVRMHACSTCVCACIPRTSHVGWHGVHHRHMASFLPRPGCDLSAGRTPVQEEKALVFKEVMAEQEHRIRDLEAQLSEVASKGKRWPF